MRKGISSVFPNGLMAHQLVLSLRRQRNDIKCGCKAGRCIVFGQSADDAYPTGPLVAILTRAGAN